MARQPRRVVTGFPHHVVNRGNDRRRLFYTNADYEQFLHLMVVGKSKYPIKVYAVAVMPNHFHAMLVPEADGALSGYLKWFEGGYGSELRAATNTVGHGHVFKQRFWSDPIMEYVHCLSVMRYIEANPFRAGLVEWCEDWPWTSAALRACQHPLLDPLPFELPRHWLTLVNLPQPHREIQAIRRELIKNRRQKVVPMAVTRILENRQTCE